MFNALFSVSHLFLLTLLSFFALTALRHLFFKRIWTKALFHLGLFGIFFIAAIGGGGVQNDGYKRLEQFILLEKNNELEHAKKNPEKYDSMLRIDFGEFKTSDEFRAYLKKHDADVDKAEAFFIAWLLAFVADVALALSHGISWLITRLKRKKMALQNA